jgi:glycosyltransferase involved in cell wall biosynthesis
VTVLRNLVPAWYLTREAVRPSGAGGRLLVGWSGSTATHPDDLQVTRGAVARALRPHVDTWGFHFIGVDRGKYEVARLLGMVGSGVPYGQTGWVDLMSGGYASAMGGLDIGIAPLELTPFNAAKSALKLLEWSALGVPCIGSPTEEYVRSAALGAGIIARNPRQWEAELKRLIGSADARAEASARGRAVAAGMTYEEHAHLWYNAWCYAADHRARARVRTNSA